jgi:hypothetical protein
MEREGDALRRSNLSGHRIGAPKIIIFPINIESVNYFGTGYLELMVGLRNDER